MKPDWKDAPAWAKYMAMNADKTWTFFQSKPIAGDYNWNSYNGMVKDVIDIINWEETLEERP